LALVKLVQFFTFNICDSIEAEVEPHEMDEALEASDFFYEVVVQIESKFIAV